MVIRSAIVIAALLLGGLLHSSAADPSGLQLERIFRFFGSSTIVSGAGDRSDAPHDPLVPALVLGFGSPAYDSPERHFGSIRLDPFGHDPRASFHAHGQQQCASGCAASRHPTATLSRQRFRELLAEMALSGPNQNNRALETLLYYGPQSRRLLSEEQFGPLDLLWKAILERELRQSHVLVSLRVLDESGRVRSRLKNVRVPLDRRHVFEMETENLQPLITSGTVKRVGLDHLWTRL